MVWLVIASGIAAIIVLRIPIGYGLCGIGFLLFAVFIPGGQVLAIGKVWNTLSDFTFTAIPLFLIMGEILLAAGVSRRMFNALAPLFRRVPGGLLHTNIAASTLFGAVSGSSISTAAAVGSVAYPELSRLGYDRRAIIATVAAGGTLGLLIPPSLALLIYGATQGVSIGRLFLAGVIPGLLLALAFMIYVSTRAVLQGFLVGGPSKGAVVVGPLKPRRVILDVTPILAIAFVVLGSIYGGFATTTEAAALGVLASAIVGFIFGDLTTHRLVDAVVSGIRVFAALAIVIVGSLILGQAITLLDMPREAIGLIQQFGGEKYFVLLAVVALYLIMGCFFDGISLMLITLPIVFPLMMSAGFDPVWTGIVITILIEIGLLTPPIGMNLYVLTAITNGEVSLLSAARAVIPYWLILLGSIAVLTMWPGLALVLPDVLM